ncbi:APC family permease [Pseudolysinimonas sp.]|uniref:APC family permease n=1 Tax=Pseudolysinimonas sp. TaxID=2680009 RepID=UPI003F801EE6
MTTPSPALQRRLGTGGAVVIGLASMIGAGVFSAFAPAAAAAGPWLLLGLAIAAFVAYANATASARLAARYPVSGGTYVYGRERLGAWWGFAAGWSFVIGKTASCAAIAFTVAAYTVPPAWQRPVAIAAVLAISLIDLFGVTKTLVAAAVLVTIVLIALVVASGSAIGATTRPLEGAAPAGPYGVLQSAGILFFAFAGYARIATLGEEVRDPARTIPRAIRIALGITLAVYAVVAVVLLVVLGAPALARSSAPLADVTRLGLGGGWAVVVGIGAVAGALGSLLSLIAGIGRTSLAMARHGDLPRALARVHGGFGTPWVAQLVVTVAVVLLVALGDLRGAIGFSSFGVLLYYAIANLSAFTLDRGRPARRILPLAGLLGCVVLALALPWPSIVVGAAVVAVGLAGRALLLRRAPGPA